MKISYNWLKEFINIDWDADKTSELLTNLGLEVEGIDVYESVKGGLKGVVVGQVIKCIKHPNADRLKLTTVDVWAGIDEKVSLGLGSDLKITLQRNKFKNLELDLPSSLGVRAPISRDQKLDELILLSTGERIKSYDLVAITDVKTKSFISALGDNLIFSIYSFFMQDETT